MSRQDPWVGRELTTRCRVVPALWDRDRLDSGKVVGDVDLLRVLPKVRAITPVPGGVGPMTIAMLLFNSIQAAKGRRGMLEVAPRPRLWT